MNTYEKHMAAIESGEVSKTNVIGIRKAINHAERLRAGLSGNRSSVTVGEAMALRRALVDNRPKVTGELHETGLAVLRNRRYAKRWKAWQQQAIDAADHFRLVGFDLIGRRGAHAVPVYALWSKVPPKGDAMDDGTYEAFHFRNVPWQTAQYEGEESGPVVVEWEKR